MTLEKREEEDEVEIDDLSSMSMEAGEFSTKEDLGRKSDKDKD